MSYDMNGVIYLCKVLWSAFYLASTYKLDTIQRNKVLYCMTINYTHSSTAYILYIFMWAHTYIFTYINGFLISECEKASFWDLNTA